MNGLGRSTRIASSSQPTFWHLLINSSEMFASTRVIHIHSICVFVLIFVPLNCAIVVCACVRDRSPVWLVAKHTYALSSVNYYYRYYFAPLISNSNTRQFYLFVRLFFHYYGFQFEFDLKKNKQFFLFDSVHWSLYRHTHTRTHTKRRLFSNVSIQLSTVF